MCAKVSISKYLRAQRELAASWSAPRFPRRWAYNLGNNGWLKRTRCRRGSLSRRTLCTERRALEVVRPPPSPEVSGRVERWARCGSVYLDDATATSLPPDGGDR